eukprot:CAMPEP_0204398710 /NCGR_PEP_ID=MMETSP0470-20130426/2988_1 /ASSEMBLY_ACC=CAM_ASM_000385 /TAXON_ID=2969 /ORGANISM="Oxyrrhis marina" /LENGTH=74 /DNA_ID=CAMNT_0051393369 /DNA_START=1 /DNA_END=222 /DNA_ORIENTATION=-
MPRWLGIALEEHDATVWIGLDLRFFYCPSGSDLAPEAFGRCMQVGACVEARDGGWFLDFPMGNGRVFVWVFVFW